MPSGTISRRGKRQSPAEPDGTPRNTNRMELRPQTHLIFLVFALLAPSFYPPFPIPDVSAVSKRLILVSGRNVGSRRNLAESHGTTDAGRTGTAGRRGNWRSPTEPDGTPRNTSRARGGDAPSNLPFFSRFSPFGSSRFLLSSPLVQYSTSRRLRNAWYRRGEGAGCRSEGEVYGDMGTSDRRGTPRNTKWRHCAIISTFLLVFALWVLSFSPCLPHSANNQHFGGFETPGIGFGTVCRREENGLWEDRRNGPLRRTD